MLVENLHYLVDTVTKTGFAKALSLDTYVDTFLILRPVFLQFTCVRTRTLQLRLFHHNILTTFITKLTPAAIAL